jgi:hypothetical protein
MNIENVTNELRTIVRAVGRLNDPEISFGERTMLNLSIGAASGNIARDFLDFREATILEAEMLEAASALPSDAAKAVLTLTVQGVAHVLFSRDRYRADGSIAIPDEDPGRDNPINRMKFIALTIDPDTLLPKVDG